MATILHGKSHLIISLHKENNTGEQKRGRPCHNIAIARLLDKTYTRVVGELILGSCKEMPCDIKKESHDVQGKKLVLHQDILQQNEMFSMIGQNIHYPFANKTCPLTLILGQLSGAVAMGSVPKICTSGSATTWTWGGGCSFFFLAYQGCFPALSLASFSLASTIHHGSSLPASVAVGGGNVS